MDTLSSIHYDGQQSFYSGDSRLVNFTDALCQTMQTSPNGIMSNIPTLASLEPVCPTLPLPPTSNAQYMGVNSPTVVHHTVYNCHTPLYEDLHPMQSPLLNHLQDEGIGSLSPTSSRRSSNNSSPINAGSPSASYPPAPECARCTRKDDITLMNNHYLCSKCFSEVSVPNQSTPVAEPALYPVQPNGPKRKRSSTTSRNEICSNCQSTLSTLWRRSTSTGNTVCNACGLYEKLHQRPRPINMRKDTIQTRKRKTKASQSPKVKKSPKKAIIKKEVEEVDQHQYVPNNTLPNYETLQAKPSHSPLASYVLHEMPNHPPVYINYRPEYNTWNRHEMHAVPPNDIISVSSYIGDSPYGVQYSQ